VRWYYIQVPKHLQYNRLNGVQNRKEQNRLVARTLEENKNRITLQINSNEIKKDGYNLVA